MIQFIYEEFIITKMRKTLNISFRNWYKEIKLIKYLKNKYLQIKLKYYRLLYKNKLK